MRVHTDLTLAEMRALPRPPGVTLFRLTEHGSRSRKRGFDLILEGTSNRGGQFGRQDYSAGTWDEWGVVLGHLFERDPTARVAKIYEGADDFHWATGDRYDPDDLPAELCKRHRWAWQGYSCENECKRCGAVRRWHTSPIGDQNPPVGVVIKATLPAKTVYGDVAPASGYADTGKLLEKILPGLLQKVKHCPDCQDPDFRVLETVIIHLNDKHRWSRERIADWLDTLDIDLAFPVPEHIPARIN